MRDGSDTSFTWSASNPLGPLVASLKYLGLGVWLAWLYLIISGTPWLSDVETNGGALAFLFLLLTLSSAVVCLLAPFLQKLYQRILASRRTLVLISLLGALGSAAIVLAGPYYLYSHWLFLPGIVCVGIASAFISLKCGQLYGSLQPLQTLVYALLSELVVITLFYFVVGNEHYRPIAGGPPLSGILALTCLPVLATCLLTARTPQMGGGGDSMSFCASVAGRRI